VALAHDPKASRQIALALVAGQLAAPATVLLARAELALGRPGEAWRQFQKAEALDPKLPRGVLAVHDSAVAATLSGAHDIAAGRYRALIPLSKMLPASRRTVVLLEAAMAVMRLGPPHLAETRGIVDYAVRDREYRGEHSLLWAVRALLDVRAGQPVSEGGVDADLLHANLSDSSRNAHSLRLPKAELSALLAAAIQAEEPLRAREYWRRFALDPMSLPWRAWLSGRVGSVEARE
jgi:hypothetical protein